MTTMVNFAAMQTTTVDGRKRQELRSFLCTVNSSVCFIACQHSASASSSCPVSVTFIMKLLLWEVGMSITVWTDVLNMIFSVIFRRDTGDDRRVDKEEFCSEKMKGTLEKWVGPIEDMGEEFDKIDANGGGQVRILSLCKATITVKMLH